MRVRNPCQCAHHGIVADCPVCNGLGHTMSSEDDDLGATPAMVAEFRGWGMGLIQNSLRAAYDLGYTTTLRSPYEKGTAHQAAFIAGRLDVLGVPK